MTEHIRIDREYGFIDTWTLTRSQLESLNLGVVIGRGVRGELTLIPFGVSVDECYQKVTALLQPPAQLITQPSTPVFVGFEVSHAQNRTPSRSSTCQATEAKRVKDRQRLESKIVQLREIQAAQPDLSVTEIAKRLGVSRQTIYNLRGLDDNDTIVLGSGTLKSAINESGAQSVQSTPCALTDQPSTATDTATRDYTFPHRNGQPSFSLS